MEENITLRKAKKEDFPKLFLLWQTAGLTVLPYKKEKKVTEQTIQRNPFSCFVLQTNDGEIIGSILGGFNGRVGSINRLAINPSFQNRGLGLSLLKKVEQILKNKGARKTAIEVLASHDEVAEFYKKHGYQDVRDQYILLKKIL